MSLFGGGRREGGDGSRSASQREKDRLERARRRAEREGLDLPPEVQPEDVLPPVEEPPPPVGEPVAFEEPPPSEEPPAAEEPPAPHPADFPPPEPVHEEPEAFAAEPVGEEAVAEALPAEPELEPAPAGPPEFASDEELEWEDPRLRDEPAAPPPTEVHDVPPRERVPEAPPEPPAPGLDAGDEGVPPPPAVPPVAAAGEGGDGERPIGLRRVGAPSVRDLPEIAGLPPRTSPPRRRRWGLRIFLVVLLALVVVAGYGLVRVFEPFAGDPTGTVRVTIPDGASASDIGDLLAERGVVDSAFFFNLRARIAGKREDLKAGTFTLQRDMTYASALDKLTTNPEPPPVIRVTLPEGPSIAEAASTVREAGIEGSYIKASRRRPSTTKGLRTYDVPRSVKTLEGFLFPATYELPRGATAGQLVREQVDTFHDQFSKVDLTRAKRRNLSAYDVVIIASMIEREAGVAKDRRLISAVIYNRLSEGMPLGIDATIRYREENWTRPLKVSELERDGAYNTRLRTGLPPTPIGNPGLASLKAAANPASVKYLYYVVKPCGDGAHAFSSTDAGFQKDVAAYNKKREELGGKDPSRC